jgi:hypothetical protein
MLYVHKPQVIPCYSMMVCMHIWLFIFYQMVYNDLFLISELGILQFCIYIILFCFSLHRFLCSLSQSCYLTSASVFSVSTQYILDTSVPSSFSSASAILTSDFTLLCLCRYPSPSSGRMHTHNNLEMTA